MWQYAAAREKIIQLIKNAKAVDWGEHRLRLFRELEEVIEHSDQRRVWRICEIISKLPARGSKPSKPKAKKTIEQEQWDEFMLGVFAAVSVDEPPRAE